MAAWNDRAVGHRLAGDREGGILEALRQLQQRQPGVVVKYLFQGPVVGIDSGVTGFGRPRKKRLESGRLQRHAGDGGGTALQHAAAVERLRVLLVVRDECLGPVLAHAIGHGVCSVWLALTSPRSICGRPVVSSLEQRNMKRSGQADDVQDKKISRHNDISVSLHCLRLSTRHKAIPTISTARGKRQTPAA